MDNRALFVKVDQLKQGDTIKFSPRNTKQYWIGKIHDFRQSWSKSTPKEHMGKIVLETIPTKMYPLSPEEEVFLVHSPQNSKVAL